ncbi:MAG: ABC transporter permease, partial [Proteobacteria bacterium]|nr:ABC transporter permease [Pseudomonadota bacterium]
MSRKRPWPLYAYAGMVYAFLYAPVLVLVAFSFNTSKRNAAWRGFTLDWYRQLLTDREIITALLNSLEIAATATIIATILGTLGALALSRSDFKARTFYETLIFIPIVIPEVVMGVALLTLFVAMGVTLGQTTVILAHAAFSISFVSVVVRARLQGSPRNLDEAAADLGATPWQTFWHVTLPLISPGVLSGALLAFTLSFDDFVISFFNSGAGGTTLPIKVYSMIKFGISPMINGVSTIMLAVTFIALLIADR